MLAFRGLPPGISLAELQSVASEKATDIIENYQCLGYILDRHQGVINKRWKKKKGFQRLKILLEVWPNMAISHRPDFAVVRRYDGKDKRASQEERDALIWPYINQQDLVKTTPLPLLLNSRGRNHPSTFAAADSNAMHLGRVTGHIFTLVLSEYAMILNGISQDHEYGRILAWKDHKDAFDSAQTRHQFRVGDGLFVLEAQSRLMRFLVACCLLILHDIPPEQLISDLYPVKGEPLSSGIADINGATSLVVMAEEAPYRPPSDIDLMRIESLLDAQVAQFEDHAWSLREDPSYFSDRLFEIREHRKEMIKDDQGSIHPTAEPPQESFWARIVFSMLGNVYLKFERYSKLRNQAAKLRQLREVHADNIIPRKDLPEEYLDALLKFRYYIEQTVRYILKQLKDAVPSSLPFRPSFIRIVPKHDGFDPIEFRRKDGSKLDKAAEQLLSLLHILSSDGQFLHQARLPLIVDELGRLLSADPEARQMVSSHVAMLISELSVLGECMRQIDTYFPWVLSFKSNLVTRLENIQRHFDESSSPERRLLKLLNETKLIALVPFADPSD